MLHSFIFKKGSAKVLNKERIKSFILILLILNSIQLTVQMWFDSNLWPSGYGFLDNIKNSTVVSAITSLFGDGGENFSGEQLYVKTMKPRRIIVNGGGAREVYLKESEFYDEAMNFVDSIMSDIKESDVSVTEVSYEEWKNMFKTKSLYVDYGYVMDVENLNKLYGTTGNSGKFKQANNFSGYILIPDTLTGTCVVCMLNEEDNTVVEHRFSSDGNGLLKFIEDSTYQKQQNDAFAFEINLDTSTETEDDVKRNVAFSPLALLTIPTEIEKIPELEIEEVFENAEELDDFSERALSIFGHNASALRKTVQNDGSITFVENNATIKFHYDGTIEYSAVSKENGLKVSNGNLGCYQAICDVLSIAALVWDKADIDVDMLDFQLTSALTDNKSNKYSIRIDNIYNGIAINFPTVCKNAIVAEVEEGYIKKFTIHLSNISVMSQKREVSPVHLAIDMLYSNYGNRSMIIDDVYKCYDFNEDGKAYVKWAFEIRGDEEILVVDSSELR